MPTRLCEDCKGSLSISSEDLLLLAIFGQPILCVTCAAKRQQAKKAARKLARMQKRNKRKGGNKK
jgi:hypothetical protein